MTNLVSINYLDILINIKHSTTRKPPFSHLEAGGLSIDVSRYTPSLLNRILKKIYGSGGIRTHASEETGALNQRLRPLGHAT